jgi:hypothetical protein
MRGRRRICVKVNEECFTIVSKYQGNNDQNRITFIRPRNCDVDEVYE